MKIKKLFLIFTIIITISILNAYNAYCYDAAQLTSPTNGSLCQELVVNYQWTQPTGAVQYKIEISQSQSFTSNIVNYTTTFNNFSSLFSTYGAKYYWRVSTTFTDNSVIVSSVSNFTIKYPDPTIITPADGDSCLSATNIFQISNNPSAGHFQFQISTSSDFQNNIVDQNNPASSCTITLPAENTTYYWHAKPVVDGCSIDWTATAVIKTTSFPPSLTNPANASTCIKPNTPISLFWGNATNAVSYHLQISSDANFGTMIYDQNNITINSATFSFPNYDVTYYWRVCANLADCSSGWSTAWSLSTMRTAPVLSLPANNSSQIALAPDFSWTMANPATYYYLDISTSASFSGTFTHIQVSSNTYSLSSSTITLAYNTVYYWRVTGYYGTCQTAYSNVNKFTTIFNTPTLSTPVTGTTCVDKNTLFSWTAVTGTTKYRLQLCTTNSFATLVGDYSDISSNSFSLTPPKGLTVYYWRVRADDGTNLGNWSNVMNFTSAVAIPVLSSPASDSINLPFKTKLIWKASSYGCKYSVQVSKDISFVNNVASITNLDSTNYTFTAPNDFTKYYWRVMANYGICTSLWSKIDSFTVSLPAPALVYPAKNATNMPITIIMSWEKIRDAKYYELDVAKDINFDSIASGNRGIPTNSFLVQNLPANKDYYWHVRAYDTDGTSSWSETWKFSVGDKTPGDFVLISPSNKETLVQIPVVFTWNTSTYASSYYIQISDNYLFKNNFVNDSTVLGTSYTFTQAENNKTYYWRVQAINATGQSNWTQYWSFQTIALKPDAAPLLTSPTDAVKDLDVNLTFTWQDVDRAYQYNFQLATDANFTTSSLVKNDSAIYKPSAYAINLSNLKTYYWRVSAWNDGGKGPWSDVWSFTTMKFVSVNDNSNSLYNIQIMPNPVLNAASIKLNIPNSEYITIKIVNSLSQVVATIANNQLLTGQKEFYFDANSLTSGVYWCVVDNGKSTEAVQMVIVK